MVANCVQTSSAFTIKPPSSSIPVDGQDRPTPATAANSLRLRRGSLLLRHLLGNGLRRTTGTTRAPRPTATPTVTTVRRSPSGRDATEQRLDRVPNFLLHHLPDDGYEALFVA